MNEKQSQLTETEYDSMDQPNVKEEAHRIVDGLSNEATWDDLMYEIYVRQTIEAGLRDSDDRRVSGVEQVRKEFGLSS